MMMKKFTAALFATALLAPIAAAPAMAREDRRDDHRQSQTVQRQGAQHQAVVKKTVTYKTFRKGQKFDRSHARNYQVVDYRRYHKLKAPPRGYHYVRSGNDVLLVGITSGIVASVVSGMFH